jgi:hypothetical protein
MEAWVLLLLLLWLFSAAIPLPWMVARRRRPLAADDDVLAADGVLAVDEQPRAYARPVDMEAYNALRRDHQKAETKAAQFLRDNLTPEQRAQLERYGDFEVTGCHTGHRYRITPQRSFNVHQLDHRIGSWCFVPMGANTRGDIMLAQKIALENYETDALHVANHVIARHRLPDSAWDAAFQMIQDRNRPT